MMDTTDLILTEPTIVTGLVPARVIGVVEESAQKVDKEGVLKTTSRGTPIFGVTVLLPRANRRVWATLFAEAAPKVGTLIVATLDVSAYVAADKTARVSYTIQQWEEVDTKGVRIV